MSVNSKMTAVADAIRKRTGGTAKLTLDTMATEIAAIPEKIDTSGTATAADIYTGKTATVSDVKITGTNPYNAANVDPAVTSALAAIAEKGVDTSGAGLADIAGLVAAIESGGGGNGAFVIEKQGTYIPAVEVNNTLSLVELLGEVPNPAENEVKVFILIHNDWGASAGRFFDDVTFVSHIMAGSNRTTPSISIRAKNFNAPLVGLTAAYENGVITLNTNAGYFYFYAGNKYSWFYGGLEKA